MPHIQTQVLTSKEAVSLFRSLTKRSTTWPSSFCYLALINGLETIGMVILDVSFPQATSVYWIGIEQGTFIIVYTGWERFWLDKEQYRNNYLYPSVSKDAATYLLTKNVAGLGIDTLSPDRPEDGFPVHHHFLGANKYLVENIANAWKMPITGAQVWISPLSIQNATESPIRLWGFF